MGVNFLSFSTNSEASRGAGILILKGLRLPSSGNNHDESQAKGFPVVNIVNHRSAMSILMRTK